MGDEYVHHVDREDRVIGRVSREEAHRLGLLHRAGCVVVFNRDGQVFVARRSRMKSIFAAHWDWPCSFHVSWGESYERAATRELVEETGSHAVPTLMGTFVIDEDPDHLIVRAYRTEHDGPLQLDPAEAEWGEFVDPTQIDKLLQQRPATSWFRPAWDLVTQR